MNTLKELIKKLNIEMRKGNNFIVIKDTPENIITELRDWGFYVVDIKNYNSFKILSSLRINFQDEHVKAIVTYEINKVTP